MAPDLNEYDEISEFRAKWKHLTDRSKGIISFIIGNSNSNQNF